MSDRYWNVLHEVWTCGWCGAVFIREVGKERSAGIPTGWQIVKHKEGMELRCAECVPKWKKDLEVINNKRLEIEESIRRMKEEGRKPK